MIAESVYAKALEAGWPPEQAQLLADALRGQLERNAEAADPGQ